MDYLEDWALIEADFQREYDINLVDELGTLSWRRFLVLLDGLSGESRYIQKVAQLVKETKNGEKVIEDPIAAERAVARIWD